MKEKIKVRKSTTLDYDNLKKQLDQREAELAIINSVGEAMSKQLDIQTVTKIVGDKVKEIFQTEVTEILLLDHKTDIINIPYSYYNGYRTYEPFLLGEGLTSKVIKSRRPLMLNTLQEQIKNGAIIQSEEDKTESYIGVPIIFGGEVLGVVSIQSYEKNVYNQNNVRLLITLSTNVGVALHNANLFETTEKLLKETEQRSAELTIINSVGEAMSKQLDVLTVTKIVGDKVREIFKSEVTEILLLDEKTNMINVPYSYYKGYQTVEPFELGAGLTSKVINSGKHLMLLSLSDQNYYGAITDENVGEADLTESYLGVPILFNDKILGVVSIQSYNKEAYNENDVRLLITLSTNMGVTLQNAKLFEETKRLLFETEQRTAELSVINSVQKGLAKELDIDGIYELVGEKIREIFNAQVIDIVKYDKTNCTIQDCYSFEKGDRTLLGPRPLKGYRKHVIETIKPLVINKDNEIESLKYGNVVVVGEKPKSLVLVPMVAGEEVTGVISLQNLDHEDAFSEPDVRLLTTLSNSMSVALENARLFDETNRLLKETEQRTAELAVINSVQEGLAKELDLNGIYNLVGERLCSLFPDTQTLVIRTFDHESGSEHWQYAIEKGERQYVEPRPFNWNSKLLIATKTHLDIRENYVETAKKYGSAGVTTGQPPKSAVFVPIIVGDIVKGSVSLQNVDKENAFSNADLRLLTTLTNSMSIALENARLFDETNRLLNETEQRNVELSILNTIQEGLVMEMDFNSIINLVGDKFREALGFLDLGIRIYDKEKSILHFPYEYEHGERLYIESGEPTPLSKYVIETGKMLLLKRVTEEEIAKLGIVGKTTIPGTDTSKSLVFVPIIVGSDVKGIILIENYEREDAFSESDIRLLTTVANSMSVALENARLFNETLRLLEETKKRAAEMSTVNNISQAIAGHLEIDKLINFVGDQVRTLFNANIVYVALLNKTMGVIEFPYGYGEEFPNLKLGEKRFDLKNYIAKKTFAY